MFTVSKGKRYTKIVRDGSAYIFIDSVTGVWYWASTWTKPSKSGVPEEIRTELRSTLSI